jgi:hypothetical protein
MSRPQTYSDYITEVRDSARYIVEQGDTVPSEDHQGSIYDRVHEWADNAVTYYADCDDILRFTENRNAAFEEYGPECIEGKDSVEQINTVLAYAAYNRDLCNAISAIDDDEAHELLGHVECEACAEWHDGDYNPNEKPPRTAEQRATECCADEEDEDDTEGGE